MAQNDEVSMNTSNCLYRFINSEQLHQQAKKLNAKTSNDNTVNIDAFTDENLLFANFDLKAINLILMISVFQFHMTKI